MTTVVLITGAAGNIGSSAAEVLADPGHTLVLADHDSAGERLRTLACSLRERGATVIESLFDVASRAEVDGAVAHCVATVGVPSLVFNNAGYQGTFERVDQMSTAEFSRVMSVNVTGVFNVIGAVSASMIATGKRGAFVNTASMAGVSGAPNMAAYSASKAAVIGLTKSAAKDLAPYGIRVNAISPAFVGPGVMWDGQVAAQAAAASQYYASDPQEVARQMIAMVPLRRYGSVLEVANVVAFLLSESASYLTGINIEVSGGST